MNLGIFAVWEVQGYGCSQGWKEWCDLLCLSVSQYPRVSWFLSPPLDRSWLCLSLGGGLTVSCCPWASLMCWVRTGGRGHRQQWAMSFQLGHARGTACLYHHANIKSQGKSLIGWACVFLDQLLWQTAYKTFQLARSRSHVYPYGWGEGSSD